ncbi:MAG: alpha/beta fold hydrolase, partial [Luteimonas sp.]
FALVRAEYARQRRALGFERRVVSVGAVRWVYVERTAARVDAPTLVMVHGYTGSKENWYRLAKVLGRGYRLLVPDLPGWGESQRVAGGDHGYAAQADNVAAFIGTVCAGRAVTLLGHSMGGGIVAVVAARHPELVARVGLFNASGVRFADNAFGLAVLAGDNPFGVHDATSLEHYLGIVFHDRAARPPMPWPGSLAVIAARRNDADFEQSVLDRIGRGDEQFLPGECAAQIHQPTLLVWGAQDRVIDASAMDLFAQRIPQARQLLIDNSGHMTLMERPDLMADAVAELVAAPDDRQNGPPPVSGAHT